MKFTSTHRRRTALLASTLALALTVTACGGGTKNSASSSSNGGGNASSNGGSSSGGNKTFVMAIQAIPDSLDATSFSGGTRPVMTVLDSLLVNYDTGSCDTAPNSEKLSGQLAKDWTYSADRKSITINLNDVKSQYGNALTSADVQWSLQRGIALSPIVKFLSSNSAHYDQTNPVTIVSPTQFKLNLTKASPLDVAMFSIPTFSIYDSTEAKKHLVAGDPWAKDWIAKNSDGFGPWQVSSFDTGNQITMTKNPGWTQPTGAYDKVILKQITSSADQSQLLQAGSINYASDLTWSQFADVSANKKATVYSCAAVSRDWLVLNFADQHLANVKVRQAISEAVDRDALVKGAYNGQGTPALNGLLDSELPQGATVQQTKHDVADAKSLMSQAGYASGFELTLNYNATQPGSQVDQLAVLLQSQLQQIGITLKLNKLASGNDLQTAHSKGTYQAELWSSSSALPSVYFDAGLIEPGSPNNSWGYKSQDYIDDVNALGAATPGSPEANAATVKIANLNITDMPVVQLVSTPNIFAMSNGLQGVNDSLRTIMIIPQPSTLS